MQIQRFENDVWSRKIYIPKRRHAQSAESLFRQEVKVVFDLKKRIGNLYFQRRLRFDNGGHVNPFLQKRPNQERKPHREE